MAVPVQLFPLPSCAFTISFLWDRRLSSWPDQQPHRHITSPFLGLACASGPFEFSNIVKGTDPLLPSCNNRQGKPERAVMKGLHCGPAQCRASVATELTTAVLQQPCKGLQGWPSRSGPAWFCESCCHAGCPGQLAPSQTSLQGQSQGQGQSLAAGEVCRSLCFP